MRDGPRKMTDVCWLLILILCVILSLIIDVYAFVNGDLHTIFSAADGDRNFCGVDEGYENYPNIYYLNYEEDD